VGLPAADSRDSENRESAVLLQREGRSLRRRSASGSAYNALLLVHEVMLGFSGARHQFDRRGSRLWSQHAVENASGVPAVLGPVGSVNFVLDALVGVDECDVLLNTPGSDPTLLPSLGAPEPMTTAPPDGSNV